MMNPGSDARLPVGGATFDARIARILANIHPDIVWSKVDDPLLAISSKWPRPLHCPRSREVCWQIVVEYYAYLLKHWLHVPVPVDTNMSSAFVATIRDHAGDFNFHMNRFLSEGCVYLDTIVDLMTTRQIEDETERHVELHINRDWEPRSWAFQQAFAQKYIEVYHLVSPYEVTLLKERLLDPRCRPWEFHCAVLRHLRERRSQLKGIFADGGRVSHANKSS